MNESIKKHDIIKEENFSLKEVSIFLGVICSLIGLSIQIFFLLKYNSLEFFSWGQVINDAIGYGWWIILINLLSFVIFKILRNKNNPLWVNLVVSFSISALILFLVSPLNSFLSSQIFFWVYPMLLIVFIVEIPFLVYQSFMNGEWFKSGAKFIWVSVVITFLIILYLWIIFPKYQSFISKKYFIDWIERNCWYQNDKYVFCNNSYTWVVIFPIEHVQKIIK
jgi:hypothetical protein